ncbi:unnamed protein product, partial [Iphiclides podalirius]
MELLETIIIILQLTNVLSKRYRSSSEESIENLIYYKDCNHKRKEGATQPTILRGPPQPPQECKMCCSMCCGDECVQSQHQSVIGRQSPIMPQSGMPKPQPFRQPVPQSAFNQKGKKKKPRQDLQPPIDGRRNVEFTREHIRSLISQDQDIRKILKDLVRVTMQKVDLMEMINSRRAVNDVNSEEEKSDDYQE